MDLQAYFKRIGYQGPTTPTLETLRGMHHAHFLNVPFENLDISRKVRIDVDEAVVFEKVVNGRRGGFCLELTGLFARALRELGFKVDVIGGRVLSDNGLSPPLSHMTLIVHLEDDWLADVGFGGRLAQPLLLKQREPQVVGQRRYIVSNDGDHWFVNCQEPGSGSGTYLFTIQPRAFEEFREVCEWLQTSPESRFTLGNVASLGTPNGRMTLGKGRFITTEGDQREELEVTSPDDERAILINKFGITLS